jgi:CubicO group peptidase (beta-lactamase class C family)
MKVTSRSFAFAAFRQPVGIAVATAFMLAATCPTPAQQVTPLSAPAAQVANPASVGVSPQRLELLTTSFTKEITDKALPGVNIMVARKGRVIYSKAFGLRDPAKSDPMTMTTLFRIYSMTKPLATVAAMILVEEGKLQISDPVAKHLPAFKDMKVQTAEGPVAARPMLVQDLMRHTSGLGYGEITQNAVVKEGYAKAGLYKPNVIDFDVRDLTPAEQVERLSKIPLIHQPGTTWEYSLSTDLLGRVVEAASGKRLGDFMTERIFRPLRMTDTAFFVPEPKLPRLAEPFPNDPATEKPFKLIDVTKLPANDSGGAGAVSTAGDYMRFAQMMLNGGTLDGARILSRNTVKWMTSDHHGSRITGEPGPGYTFGLGFAVRRGDGLSFSPGSAGDYNWSGYAGTAFWIDPKEQLIGVMMMQSPGAMRLYHRNLLRQLVYQAIVD